MRGLSGSLEGWAAVSIADFLKGYLASLGGAEHKLKGVYSMDVEEIVLEPCPFCGDKEPEIIDKDYELYVECPNCGARGPFSYFGASSYDEAYIGIQKEWNERAGR